MAPGVLRSRSVLGDVVETGEEVSRTSCSPDPITSSMPGNSDALETSIVACHCQPLSPSWVTFRNGIKMNTPGAAEIETPTLCRAPITLSAIYLCMDMVLKTPHAGCMADDDQPVLQISYPG